jgi:hypothetical protein
MTMKSFLRISTLAALTLPLIASAQQAPQTPPAQQPQANSAATKTAPAKPAPAKKAVVWNDDNIGSIRSSADNYQIVQAQQEEAQKAADKQSASNQPAADSSGAKTAEQLDSMIASKSHDLAGEQDYVKNLQKQVADPTLTGTDRQRLEWRLKSHTVTEQTLQSDIKQLQADKDALAKKQAASSSSSQPQSR